jgi:hypothetical protein
MKKYVKHYALLLLVVAVLDVDGGSGGKDLHKKNVPKTPPTFFCLSFLSQIELSFC